MIGLTADEMVKHPVPHVKALGLLLQNPFMRPELNVSGEVGGIISMETLSDENVFASEFIGSASVGYEVELEWGRGKGWDKNTQYNVGITVAWTTDKQATLSDARGISVSLNNSARSGALNGTIIGLGETYTANGVVFNSVHLGLSSSHTDSLEVGLQVTGSGIRLEPLTSREMSNITGQGISFQGGNSINDQLAYYHLDNMINNPHAFQ